MANIENSLVRLVLKKTLLILSLLQVKLLILKKPTVTKAVPAEQLLNVLLVTTNTKRYYITKNLLLL